jgi:DNA-binding LacI/PurR family transcriptional regulator
MAEPTPRQRALAALRDLIQHGAVSAGQALPAERQLAQQLGVARVTVRSALAELAREGLLDASFRRKRRVAGLASGGLMAQTVAMLSPWHRDDRFRQRRGTDLFIQAELIRLVEAGGHHVLTLNPQKLLDGGLAHLLAQRPRGILVAGHDMGERAEGRRLIEACVGAGIPLVAYSYAPDLPCDTVASDQEAGCRELVRWLAARGRRRLLRLWRFAGSWGWLVARNAGYERGVREAGLPALPAVHTKDLPHDSGTEPAFRDLARSIAGYLIEHLCCPAPVDAILVASDPHAYQVAAALRLFGLRPNQDVDVVGYDRVSQPVGGHAWEPEGPLATLDRCDARIAAEMVALLDDRIAGRLPAAAQHRLVVGDLIELPRATVA